jgi:preprotein translocase subunit SecG
MSLMLSTLMIVQVLSALAIIVLVLLQQGKGADMGSAFGTGSAGSLFGASGAANFLSRTTKWAAVVFFVSTAGLAYVSHKGTGPAAVDTGVMSGYQAPADKSVPQAPGGGAAAPAPGAAGDASVPSVPGAASAPAPAQSAPATPDASVPQAPAGSAPAAPAKPATPAK